MIEHNECLQLVFDIIKKYATEIEPIDQNRIIAIMRQDGSEGCERKTVSRYLGKLRDKYGYDDENRCWKNDDIRLHYRTIERSSSPIYDRYWFEIIDDDAFSDEELLFLMDAVQFSKHVPPKYAEEITKKLSSLSSHRYSNMFKFNVRVNEKDVPFNQAFFLNLGEIRKAILLSCKISFYNNRYGTDKKLHHTSEEPVVTCPYNVIVTNGNYYLLCGEFGSHTIKSYRIDMITDLCVLDETYTHSAARSEAVNHPEDYIVEHCYMSSGKPVEVLLDVDMSLIGDVIDSFGKKIRIEPAEDGGSRVTVRITSTEKDAIDWVMRYGEYASILEPDYLVEEMRIRARNIERAHSDEDSEERYRRTVEDRRGSEMLFLNHVDLNGKESYKHLEGVTRARFNDNRIKDFSFLSSYTQLRDLTVSHNEIADPGVLSGLTNLRFLNLYMTGITDLEFLRGLTGLRSLTLKEYTLENVEALYSLPDLKSLSVNRPVSKLIDKKRLKEVYGENFRYCVNSSGYIGYMNRFDDALPLENRRFSPGENDHEYMAGLFTHELTDASVKEELIQMMFVRTYPGPETRFRVYEGTVEGSEKAVISGDPSILLGPDYTWYVTYENESNSGNIHVISIFRHDHGNKLAVLARRFTERPETDDIKARMDAFRKRELMMTRHLDHMYEFRYGWAEVSGRAEMLFSRYSIMSDLIKPTALKNKKVFDGIEADDDGYHYYRKVQGMKRRVRKICYGHLE